MTRSLKAQRDIARAQLRAIHKALAEIPSAAPVHVRKKGEAARFVHCWPVSRGYFQTTQALDEDGQVWERVSLLENKVLVDSWWEPIPMTRKAAKEKKA